MPLFWFVENTSTAFWAIQKKESFKWTRGHRLLKYIYIYIFCSSTYYDLKTTFFLERTTCVFKKKKNNNRRKTDYYFAEINVDHNVEHSVQRVPIPISIISIPLVLLKRTSIKKTCAHPTMESIWIHHAFSTDIVGNLVFLKYSQIYCRTKDVSLGYIRKCRPVRQRQPIKPAKIRAHS